MNIAQEHTKFLGFLYLFNKEQEYNIFVYKKVKNMTPIEITVLILSSVDAFCCVVCRVPQLVRLIKLKESQAISIPYWSLNILSCVMCITAYSLQLSIGNISMIIFLCSATFNLVLNTLIYILVRKYRKNTPKEKINNLEAQK